MADKVVFRKTPGSRWCVMLYVRQNGRHEAYGHHSKCEKTNTGSKGLKQEWSWLVGDVNNHPGNNPTCHECGTRVPAYIVTLVRLYEGK